MILAEYTDKEWIVGILSEAFNDNKSVNYIVKQDEKKEERIKHLMGYSFEVCHHFGQVFLSNDKNACALIVLPEKKKTTLHSIVWDAKLIVSSIGLSNIKKAIKRESKIKGLQPKEPIYYLWFIGVRPAQQGEGIGSALLKEIIRESESINRTICLETSTPRNLPWYQKFGFTIYNELNLGYRLFFLKRNPGN